MTPAAESSVWMQAERYFEALGCLYGPELYFDPAPRRVAAPPSDLESLRALVESCRGCGLGATRRRPVFGEGAPSGRLMLIGEAPGGEEDLAGRPFAGAAGRLLDNMLRAVGFDRAEVYIADLVKCRPPEDREPLPAEAEACAVHLKRQIELVRPGILLALGRFAARHLLGKDDSLQAFREGVHEAYGIPCLVTYPPSELLGDPASKYPAWEDLKRMRRLYDARVGDKPGWIPPKGAA